MIFALIRLNLHYIEHSIENNFNRLLSNFLFRYLLPFPKELNPKIGNPQYTNRYGHHNNDKPRNPNPFGYHTIRSPTQVEGNHPIHKIRTQKTPHDRIQSIKGRRQNIIHLSCKFDIRSPGASQRPHILAQAGDLGQN